MTFDWRIRHTQPCSRGSRVAAITGRWHDGCEDHTILAVRTYKNFAIGICCSQWSDCSDWSQLRLANKKHLKTVLGPFATASRRTPPVLHCHSPGIATVARRHCRTLPALGCPQQRQQRQCVTEGTVMANYWQLFNGNYSPTVHAVAAMWSMKRSDSARHSSMIACFNWSTANFAAFYWKFWAVGLFREAIWVSLLEMRENISATEIEARHSPKFCRTAQTSLLCSLRLCS